MFATRKSEETSLYKPDGRVCLSSQEGDGDQQHQLQTGGGGSPEHRPAEEEQGAAGQTVCLCVK